MKLFEVSPWRDEEGIRVPQRGQVEVDQFDPAEQLFSERWFRLAVCDYDKKEIDDGVFELSVEVCDQPDVINQAVQAIVKYIDNGAKIIDTKVEDIDAETKRLVIVYDTIAR